MRRVDQVHALFLLATPPEPYARFPQALREAFPGMRVSHAKRHQDAAPIMHDVDALFTFGAQMADDVLADAPRLRWVQSLGTGTDGIVDRLTHRSDVVVTNTNGIHGPAMSEAALGAMLALARQIPRSVRAQDAGLWDRFAPGLLNGKTVAVIGIGRIASAFAPRASALGMSVIGVSSTPRREAGFDRIVPRANLDDALRVADFVVVLVPPSETTRHILGRQAFGALKHGAYLINLARAGVIDEAALLDALRDGTLAGAALDVFQTEPLPADHPFWRMKNVLMTPHQAGFSEDYPERVLPHLIANMRAFLSEDHTAFTNVVVAAR